MARRIGVVGALLMFGAIPPATAQGSTCTADPAGITTCSLDPAQTIDRFGVRRQVPQPGITLDLMEGNAGDNTLIDRDRIDVLRPADDDPTVRETCTIASNGTTRCR